MRESGSTIEIKVKADVSGIAGQMKAVESEINKAGSATERLSKSTDKSSKQFNKLSTEIRKAMTEFKATGNLDEANLKFANLENRVGDYGDRLRAVGKDLDTFFQLQNRLTDAQAAVDRANNNSKGVLDARARSEQNLATQTRKANRQLTDTVRGTISELRRLSVEGKGSAEQIERLFGRAVKSAQDLDVTTEDLVKTYGKLRTTVESSNLSYKTQQTLINNVKVAQEQSAQSMRVMNKGLSQQENGVGDVSYAMMSFTRLLEDTPYGFRGFANNIQPTIFGLVQMNEVTIQAAENFRKMHGREMPLAQRAMLNFKTALKGPINQLLLLTSVIAVAGTLIERYSQQSNKAKQVTKELGDEFLRLYDVTKGDNPLMVDFSQSTKGLEDYATALGNVAKNATATFVGLSTFRTAIGPVAQSVAEFFMPALKEQVALAKQNFDTATGLSEEAKARLKTIQTEAEVQLYILENQEIRAAVERQINENRVRTANDEIFKTQELIEIEKIRQSQGEEAAVRQQSLYKTQSIQNDTTLDSEQKEVLLKEEQLKLDYEILRLGGKKTNENKKQVEQYASMMQNLRRLLEDEEERTTVAELELQKRREIADLEVSLAERRRDNEKISAEQEKVLIDLIEQRYGILIQVATLESTKTVQALAEQAMLSDRLVQIEQKRLLGQYDSVISLEAQVKEIEYQQALARALGEIELKNYATTQDKEDAIARTTEEFRNQYRLALLISQLQEQRTIDEFLRPSMSEEDGVVQRAEEARLANLAYYEAEKQKIKDQSALSDYERAKSLAEAYNTFLKTEQDITDKGTKEVAAIRFRNQTEGILMVTSALEQFVGGMDASSKKQFENQKKLAIGLAGLNTYLAVSQVLADDTIKPSWLKYPAAAAMLIQGLAQVNSIRNTKYGSAGSSSGVRGGAPSQQGFQEVASTQNAMSGVGATMNTQAPATNITVIGNVDREGIAFAVREGENSISSRATFAR
jgi:hypothetical protein